MSRGCPSILSPVVAAPAVVLDAALAMLGAVVLVLAAADQHHSIAAAQFRLRFVGPAKTELRTLRWEVLI